VELRLSLPSGHRRKRTGCGAGWLSKRCGGQVGVTVAGRGKTLGFWCSEDCLALSFSLAANLGEALFFSRTGGFRGLGGQSGSQLRFFLVLALRLFFLAATFFGGCFLGTQTGFFASYCPRGGKIAVFGSVQIGPRIQRGDIVGRRRFALVGR